MNKQSMAMLVGDNPFHGISHLSQRRARDRLADRTELDVPYASQIIKTSLETGATGFMFSVSETTLSIIKAVDRRDLDLYAIVPYAYEYVRIANSLGGLSGLSKKVARKIILSRNVLMISPNLIGLAKFDTSSFLKTYLIYEISRILKAAKHKTQLKSVLLHEIITDMGLAFNLEWLFKSFIEFLQKRRIKPGFETRNFAYLVTKFKDWGIDFRTVAIAAPFNKIGFQMNPSQVACESALEDAQHAEVIAMSIMAAGYLRLPEALDYIHGLQKLSGVVVGFSKESQAKEMFCALRQSLSSE